MPFQLTIPANGSSVPVRDFTAVAERTYDAWLEGAGKEATEEQKDQLRAAIDAADTLVAAGHIGSDNVYVVLGGNATDGHKAPTPGVLESLVSIGVYQRPAPVAVEAPDGEATPPAPKSKKGGK